MISILKNIIQVLLFFSLATLKINAVHSQTTNCQSRLDTITNQVLKHISESEKNDLIACLYSIQNRGFQLEENECNYDSSKYYIEKALTGWISLNDTNNQANLLKYLGYLNGKLGNFELATKQIEQAISLYNSKSNIQGVAVSLLNLAKVHEYENKFHLAINYTSESYSVWKFKKDTSRLMLTNNNLIHLHSKISSEVSIQKTINENSYYLLKFNIHWLQELDFYYVLYEYYKSIRANEKSDTYFKLYQNKMQNIYESQQLKKHSIYDPQNCR